MLKLAASICVFGAVVVVGSSEPAMTERSLSLAEMADRYCIRPDGDHRMTWTLAEQDSFTFLQPEEFSGLRALGIHDDTLRGLRRVDDDGREVKVLTAASWLTRPDQGKTFFRWCWVSSSDDRIDAVHRQLRGRFKDRGFRLERVRMYAWIPRPDGMAERVSRRDFIREGNILARDQGMRQVIARARLGSVFIGFASPRDEATYRDVDWSGPDAVPRPQG